MTKQERKLKSMLNYFQVDLKGLTDEKLSVKEKTKLIDRFNKTYDALILQDILEKIKQKRKDEIDPQFDEEKEDFDDEDWMLPSDENFNDSFNEEKKPTEKDKSLSDPISTDINKFLRWLTLILYSGNHSVIISEDKNGIYIKLIKINSDKGKK